MAYLHCHNCGWEQDDFYTKRYNPLTKIMNVFKQYLFPKPIRLDWEYIKLITRDGIFILVRQYVPSELEKEQDKEKFGTYINYDNQVEIFSWSLLIYDLIHIIKSYRNMKWKTEKEWNRVKDFAKCPKCGKRDWDID